MKPIKYWTDLYGLMPNHTILAYSRIYEDPEVSFQRTVAQDFSRTKFYRGFQCEKMKDFKDKLTVYTEYSSGP